MRFKLLSMILSMGAASLLAFWQHARQIPPTPRELQRAPRAAAFTRPTARRSEPSLHKIGVQEGPPDSLTVDEGKMLRQEYEKMFASEEVDQDWALGEEDRLERRWSAALPQNSQLKSIACHSSLCRIQIWHEDSSRADDCVNQALATDDHWLGESFASLDEALDDGMVSQVIFLKHE